MPTTPCEKWSTWQSGALCTKEERCSREETRKRNAATYTLHAVDRAVLMYLMLRSREKGNISWIWDQT